MRSRVTDKWLQCAWALAASFVADAATARPAVAVNGDEWAYRIERGDTLIGLQARLLRPDARWRDLQRLNRIANPRRLQPGSTLRIPLAMLRQESAAAEVLHVHGQVWVERQGVRLPLEATASVAVGDVVVTGAQSSLSLRFVDGSRAGIGPDSRLRVERHTRLGASGVVDTRVRLDAGSVQTQVPPARVSPRFELHTPVINLGVRGTEFRTRVDGERTVAETLQGRVALGPQALDAGFGAAATARGVGPLRPLPAAPDPSGWPERVDRLPLRVALSPAAGRYRVQVYDGVDPQRLLLDGLFAPPQAEWPVNLPDGSYLLRVRAADAEGIEGHDSSRAFVLAARPEPPFLLRPRAGERLGSEAVTLAWARNPEAAAYRLQLAPAADFLSPQVDRAGLTGNQLQLNLPPGLHHWRVASQRADGRTGPWGDAQVFERLQPPPPAPPPPPAAPAAPQLQPAQAGDDGLVFSWSAAAQPGASYQVQVARDAAFADLVLDRRTTQTEQQFGSPAPGTYHLRVRTITSDGREGEFGSPQVVEVARPTTWWPWLLLLLPLL